MLRFFSVVLPAEHLSGCSQVTSAQPVSKWRLRCAADEADLHINEIHHEVAIIL